MNFTSLNDWLTRPTHWRSSSQREPEMRSPSKDIVALSPDCSLHNLESCIELSIPRQVTKELQGLDGAHIRHSLQHLCDTKSLALSGFHMLAIATTRQLVPVIPCGCLCEKVVPYTSLQHVWTNRACWTSMRG